MNICLLLNCPSPLTPVLKLDEVNLIILSSDLIQLDLILILKKRCVADPAGGLV